MPNGTVRLVTTLLAVGCCASAATDEAVIRALIDRYYAAAKAKDVQGVMTCYATTDNVFVFDVAPPRPFRGVASVTKDWSDYFAGVKVIDIEPAEVEVSVAGEIAYSHFIEHVMTGPPGARQIKLSLRTTHIYRKMGGRWLIVHEHKSKSIQNEGPPPK